MANAKTVVNNALKIISVPKNITGADWADENFYLSSESSNTSGKWKTTVVQKAVINSFCNDAIEKVDFFKPTRFGGTKMAIASMFYFIAHKKRNACFYQPTDKDRDEFVKTEVQPAIRDCRVVSENLLSKSDKSTNNTLSYKAFTGCTSYFKGGHTPKSYERMTLDVVFIDEIDQFSPDVGGRGDPTTLSWGRVRNSLFKKQITTSKPTIKGFSLIEKASKLALDNLQFYAECPCCKEFTPIEWGGKDVAHGFKWTDNDADTVMHICKICGQGWGNNKLTQALKYGYWQGEKGYKTYDGIEWTLHGEKVNAPRHISFKSWSGYSQLTTWKQLVQEWLDAQKDIKKIQAFTNNVLAESWDLEHKNTVTDKDVEGILPVNDISKIIAVTAGVDTQNDRLEVQYVGHDLDGNIYVLDYSIIRGDMRDPKTYGKMGTEVLKARFNNGEKELKVLCCCIDTQGHHTDMVHKFLIAVKKYEVFVGINGTGYFTYAMADKPSTYKDIEGSSFYSIGVNIFKLMVYDAISNHDAEFKSFRIWDGATLPSDYSAQLTVEKMEVKTVKNVPRVVFTNNAQARNEALDTLVYALAGKEYIKKHRGRLGRLLFDRGQ